MSGTIDTKYVAEFLEKRESLTKPQAQSTAFNLMLRLMEVPGVTFFCRNEDCGKIKGECRCHANGYASQEGWKYRAITGPWLCSVESLVHLPDATIQILGPKAQLRLKSLIMHLQRQ